MITFILVLAVISILILAHEWGHFYFARRFGIKVEEFAFGFPPKIWSKVKDGITYSINALPFGGFVRIFGEHGEGEGDPTSFVSQSAFRRFAVLAAGVGMNLAVAWVFFSFGSLFGIPEIDDQPSSATPVSIISVLPNSPAEESGLRFGDEIMEIKAEDSISLRIETEKDVQDFIDAYRGEEITLVVKHGKEVREVKAIPRLLYPENEGPLGVALARLTVRQVPWFLTPWEGFKNLARGLLATIQGLFTIIKDLITERKAAPVSGPIGIVFLIRDVRSLGLAYLLQFIGMLSLNLAILNFLPIPALDGGRILFLILEKIKRGKINPKYENMAHSLGFLALIILMILITYRDIVRVF